MENNLISQFQQFQEAVRNDRLGDKKSVCFEGGVFSEVDDFLDDPHAHGEYGFGALESLDNKKWSLYAPLSGNVRVLTDDETRYVSRGDDRLLEVVPVAYADAEAALEQEDTLEQVDVTESLFYRNMKKRYLNVRVFRGLREYDGESLVGYVAILEDFFDNAYQIAWFGIGNVAWIWSDAEGVFNSFMIHLNLDE